MRADLGDVAHGTHQLICAASGVAGGEADAADAGDDADRLQQTREIFAEIAGAGGGAVPDWIGVAVAHDALTQQRHFTHAAFSQLAHFVEDLGGGAAIFGAAHIRDHAIGAAAVAPQQDGDKGADGTGQVRI